MGLLRLDQVASGYKLFNLRLTLIESLKQLDIIAHTFQQLTTLRVRLCKLESCCQMRRHRKCFIFPVAHENCSQRFSSRVVINLSMGHHFLQNIRHILQQALDVVDSVFKLSFDDFRIRFTYTLPQVEELRSDVIDASQLLSLL